MGPVLVLDLEVHLAQGSVSTFLIERHCWDLYGMNKRDITKAGSKRELPVFFL